MSTPVITCFNNKGGVGKTSLVYHIAWMLSEQRVRVLIADLDPQGNLSAAFLDEERLEQLWPENGHQSTMYGAVRPLKCGVGDIEDPLLEQITDHLALIPGDMALSEFEEDLSQAWPKCLDGDERAFRVVSAFWRVVQRGADDHRADVVLIDLGPNLGAINRSALIASDHFVVPLAPDLFSLQGLRNLGPTLRDWRRGWTARLERNPDPELALPVGAMAPLGYVVMQHSVRRDRPVKSSERWIARIPTTYRKYLLDQDPTGAPAVGDDPHCFGLLKHYHSLMPMAQEARKPMFLLRPADGALGSHAMAVRGAYGEFADLTRQITTHAKIPVAAAP